VQCIYTWLGKGFLVKTFDDEINEEYLERNIQEIRELLNEQDSDT
jgi:hypothetical protein